MNIYDYYKREDVLEEILRVSESREVCFTLPDGGYTARPGIIQYKKDILETIKRGCLSIHGSVERWSNPMQIRTGMSHEELNALRTGWDLIIDIDSALKDTALHPTRRIDAAKLAAKRVVEFLKKFGLNPSIKFSGNRGFHIAVPFESFPETIDFIKTKDDYPRIPRIITSFIKDGVKEDLSADLIGLAGSWRALCEELDMYSATPYDAVDVRDQPSGIEKGWGLRHLFRMPFSLNTKSGLASIPIKNIDSFSIDMAKPENVAVEKSFLFYSGDATELVSKAFKWNRENSGPESQTNKTAQKSEFKPSGERIPEERFPPCVKNILMGLKDGKKRSLFVLINYLRSVNWDFSEIETRIMEWNAKNLPSLPQTYVRGQISYASRSKPFLPPNCEKIKGFEFGICTPDQRCQRIKNPANYAAATKNTERPKPPPEKKTRRKRVMERD